MKDHSQDIKLEEKEFLVKDFVGEGRFARVHKGCRESEKDRFVAIRFLKFTESAVFDEMKFLKEAEELVKIKHINIIKTYGVLVNQKAFVQEFCVKKIGEERVHSLSGLLSCLKDKISEKVKLICFCHITNALQFLHSLEIVVGDLKPANVLVTSDINEDWIFKLGDICPETKKRNNCSAAMSSCVSTKDSFVYTAAFMAPELLMYHSKKVCKNISTSSDIYSLAMLLYQVMFPNTTVFQEMSPMQFIFAIGNNWRPEIPLEETYNGNYYKELVDILKKCWVAEPCLRPTSDVLYKEFQQINFTLSKEGNKRLFKILVKPNRKSYFL